MEPTPRILEILAWFLLGPSWPTFLVFPLVVVVLACALILKRHYRGISIALLSLLGLLFGESLLLVVRGVRKIELMRSGLATIEHMLPLPFTLNLGLAMVGALAAIGTAVYVEFGRARLPLAQLFPEVQFTEATLQLTERVKRLAAMAGVTAPDVSLIDSGTLSAFITRSRTRFVIALSVGLIESMDESELDACIAHELAHLKNKDFSLRFFATMAKVGLFARPLSYIIESAVYRAREHLADFTAAKLMGPGVLISALSKIQESQAESIAGGAIGTACLIEPVSRMTGLLNKQPSLEARISALREL
jgi:heat shock protein HtpX